MKKIAVSNPRSFRRIPAAFVPVLVYFVLSGVLIRQEAKISRLEHATYPPAPKGMVFVPAGDFLTGSADPRASQDEGRLRQQFLPAFYIDACEVTNAEFAAFDSGHKFVSGIGNCPVTGVTLARAREYAAWAGKRLPTRLEWEKAARGTDGREYPWGTVFRAGIANIAGGPGLCAVGTHPESASPYGVQDMVGNAWEWVDDLHTDGWLTGTDRFRREVIKGGGFAYSAHEGRASYNGFEALGGTCNDVGFRCAQDAHPLPR